MTATQTTITPTYQVGDRTQVQHQGTPTPGRISSIHRNDNGIEYVVRTDPADGGLGGLGHVLNIWTTSRQFSFFRRATVIVTGVTR
jgi:hypothetical protein